MRTHNVKFKGFFKNIDELDKSKMVYEKYNTPTNTKESALNGIKSKNTQEYQKFIKTFNDKKLNIVDFGGGAGGHYFIIDENYRNNINYHVVDLSCNFIYEEIKYYTNIKDIKIKPDIVYSNATIYVTPQDFSAVENIDNFCQLDSEYIFLQRAILYMGNNYDHFYTYVNAQKCYYSIMSVQKLEEIIENYGYNIKTQEENCGDPIKFGISKCPNDMDDIRYQNILIEKI